MTNSRRYFATVLSVALLTAGGAKLLTSTEFGMSSTTGKSAYIDKSGKAVIDASRYESAGDFWTASLWFRLRSKGGASSIKRVRSR